MPAPAAGRLVALSLPPGEEFIAALDASWERGDAVLPLDPGAPTDVQRSLLAAMRPDRPISTGVGLVIATSGSTGTPKGAQLSRAALDASARACHERIGLLPGDVWLSCLPWHHIGGLQVMLRSRLLGVPLVVHERFDVDRVAAAEATLTSLVPTQLQRLLDAGVDLARFRVILLGGAAAPLELLARARRAGGNVVTTYGMSETAGGCVYDGRPLDGAEVRIDDAGRICLRGPMLMSGYRMAADETAAVLVDGWLVTNDLGRLSADGTLSVLGRADDVIVTGGENVAAGAVADLLARHPAVREAAVVGVPDEEWGQRVTAVVVPTATVGLADLRDWCAASLPRAALPRGLVTVDVLPRLATGKLDRLAVQRLAIDAG